MRAMKLTDCDTTRLHLRGSSAAMVVGERAATDAELASLLVEYRASFGMEITPIYYSRDGWQGFPTGAAAVEAPKGVFSIKSATLTDAPPAEQAAKKGGR